MQKDISPNENECNFIYNILKNDPSFCKKIVESLPTQCKTGKYKEYKQYDEDSNWLSKKWATVQNTFIVLSNPFVNGAGYLTGKEDKIIIDEIFKTMKKCILYKIKEPLDNFEWNKKDYVSKSAKEILNSIKLLKERIPLRRNDNMIDVFSEYIYGSTPLKKAIQKTIEIIKKDSKNTIKIIVILSDGESTDGNPNDLKHLINEKSTYIVSLYFSSNKVKKPKQLYFNKPNGGIGLDQIYDLASEINPYSPIYDMLEKRGWEINYTKKSKLFIQANNIKIFEEFLDILNSFINGQNILGNMISTIELNEYITNYNKDHRINENQIGPICWCHSLAKVIEYASHRIYRGKYKSKYPYPIFTELRDYLIKEYDEQKGKTNEEMMKILDQILPNYYLRYSGYYIIQEENAKKALMKGRPLVYTYKFTAKQNANFHQFFRENKTGILTKEILNRNIPYDSYKYYNEGGHAVILIEYNEDGFVLLNSWGEDFGDKGKFRIKNLNVLTNPFIIDVYVDKNKLPDELKREWIEYCQENERIFKDKYFESGNDL